jgi:hypothetical protein
MLQGYGLVFPGTGATVVSNINHCTGVTIVASVESFVGILFASFLKHAPDLSSHISSKSVAVPYSRISDFK